MRSDLRPGGSPERSHPAVDAGRPASDREVPIDGMRRNGEFWNTFEEQLSARRLLRAPAGFAARVMAALQVELPG